MNRTTRSALLVLALLASACASGGDDGSQGGAPPTGVTLKPGAVLVGERASIDGKVDPALAGREVVLQLEGKKGYRKVETTKVSDGGSYSFALKPKKSARYSYRVVEPAAGDGTINQGPFRLDAYDAEIVRIRFDAPGPNEFRNLNGEFVEVRNTGKVTIQLAGWKLGSTDQGQRQTLPSYALDPGERVRIHTGEGETKPGHVYVDAGRPIWNNEGDTGRLIDPNGALVDEHTYEA